MATKNEKPATEVVTQNTIEIVDNTDVQAVPEKPVESEEYELMGGIVQVNYK